MVCAMNPTFTEREILDEADRCVKCGLCLPHCPTWQVHRHEGDSPRGRIELVSALADGSMEINPVLQEHLEGCLLCRTCESVCPAQVSFGRLMDRARARWPFRRIWWSRLFCSGIGRGLIRFGLWLASGSGLARSGRVPAGLRARALLALLPDSVVLRRRRLEGDGQARVGLFTGCVSDTVDRATLNDSAVLIERCGNQVVWVKGSGCCGALDRHQGDAERADAHVRRNARDIGLQSLAALVSVATGCSAELMEYDHLPDDLGARGWKDKHREVMTYLFSQRQKLMFKPLRQTVMLHHPCSARNVLRDVGSAIGLLRKVPHLQVVESASPHCCGAAGVAMFRTPQTAQVLAREVVEEFSRSGAKVLLTANVGCALHLRGTLRAVGLKAAVKHPVNLLREQLRD